MKIYFPQWLVILICPLFFQCASTHRRKLPDPVFPEIDVVRMKESSDEALRLSQENKLDLDMLESKLVEIENRLMYDLGRTADQRSSIRPIWLESRMASCSSIASRSAKRSGAASTPRISIRSVSGPTGSSACAPAIRLNSRTVKRGYKPF